jgi:hypothetical protein
MICCKSRLYYQKSSNRNEIKKNQVSRPESRTLPHFNPTPHQPRTWNPELRTAPHPHLLRTENREPLPQSPNSRLTLHDSRLTPYSYLSASTGLVLAVFTDCQVTATNAIANAINIASAYIHQLILVR